MQGTVYFQVGMCYLVKVQKKKPLAHYRSLCNYGEHQPGS